VRGGLRRGKYEETCLTALTLLKHSCRTTLNWNGRALPIDNNLAIIAPTHTLHYDPVVHAEPSKFQPERFLGSDSVPRSSFRTFGRGVRACLGQHLAIEELRTILLLIIRDFDFECAGLKPNSIPRTVYTNLDLTFGDIVFQEMGIEAKPRGGMMMRVSKNVRSGGSR
jgi:hypothetical protein